MHYESEDELETVMEQAWVCPEEDTGEKYCPVCDEKNPETFYFNHCLETVVGCEACISQADWHEAAALLTNR